MLNKGVVKYLYYATCFFLSTSSLVAAAGGPVEVVQSSLAWYKDLATMGAAIVAAAVAVYGVRNGLKAARSSVEERKNENRQRQLAVSRNIFKDIFDDPLARAAMRMMDWSGRRFQHDGSVHIVSWKELRPALINHCTVGGFTPKQEFIRDSFEAFFDHMQLLAHFIKKEYLNEADIAVPLKYYAIRVISYPDTYAAFLTEYGYEDAEKLMMRLGQLRTSASD